MAAISPIPHKGQRAPSVQQTFPLHTNHLFTSPRWRNRVTAVKHKRHRGDVKTTIFRIEKRQISHRHLHTTPAPYSATATPKINFFHPQNHDSHGKEPPKTPISSKKASHLEKKIKIHSRQNILTNRQPHTPQNVKSNVFITFLQ